VIVVSQFRRWGTPSRKGGLLAAGAYEKKPAKRKPKNIKLLGKAKPLLNGVLILDVRLQNHPFDQGCEVDGMLKPQLPHHLGGKLAVSPKGTKSLGCH
jgi:hypothetical protein